MPSTATHLVLGCDHYLSITGWPTNPAHPDLPAEDYLAATLHHPGPHGQRCEVRFMFDNPTSRMLAPRRAKWAMTHRPPRITIAEPLTCLECGDTGRVVDGLWVPR